MEAGRLVVDEPLANRVRSGRKQPQRAPARVIVPASHLLRPVGTRVRTAAGSMSDDTSISSVEKPAAYRVLARKYRPKDFSDLMVGQEPMVRTLTNAFETGRIAQAYTLTG